MRAFAALQWLQVLKVYNFTRLCCTAVPFPDCSCEAAAARRRAGILAYAARGVEAIVRRGRASGRRRRFNISFHGRRPSGV
jgi:hypothetical protein